MKYVKSHTSILVPEVYGFCADKENPVGAIYVFMAGRTSERLHILPKIPDQFKDYVYTQYATIILELSSLTWLNIKLLQHNREEFSITTSIVE
jgi:hypothetical protein